MAEFVPALYVYLLALSKYLQDTPGIKVYHLTGKIGSCVFWNDLYDGFDENPGIIMLCNI